MFSFDSVINFETRENDVLTVGELLIDMISTDYDGDFEGNTYNKFFGGSPANVAMNVKRLGVKSMIVSAVGQDGLGRFLIKCLEKSKVNTSCIQEVDYSTSMVLITKSKGSPLPIFYREADYHLSYDANLQEAIANSKIIHFSCWPISQTPARNTIQRVIEEGRKNDALICFDPNYHPKIWQKGENGLEYIKSMIGKVDIIKPSEDDAERLFGEDTHENQIKKFLDLGAKLVIMTLGQKGAIACNGVETISFNSLAKEVVDTTGAGDAFWSGFYASIVKGYTIKEGIELGLAVSAYKLKYTGAVVELPKLEEIKEGL